MPNQPSDTTREEGGEREPDIAQAISAFESAVIAGAYYETPSVDDCRSAIIAAAEARASKAEAEVERLTRERDEALFLAEGPGTLRDMACTLVDRTRDLCKAEAEASALRHLVETLTLRDQQMGYRVEAAEAITEALRDRVARLEGLAGHILDAQAIYSYAEPNFGVLLSLKEKARAALKGADE